MPDFDSLYNPDLSTLPSEVSDPQLTPIQDPFQSNGYTPNIGINYVDSALADLDKSLSGKSWDNMLQPVAYDRKVTNADRYQHSDYFGELGFNPFSNNEERYGNRQTNWNKLGNAFGGSWQLIKNQFVEQAASWGDTLDFFNSNKSAFEQADFEEINKQQKSLFNDYPIYETAEQRDSIWNFNTIANTVQQSGYAVGAVAEIAAEEVVLSLLTAATLGGTSELQAARSLKLATSIGRVLRKTERLGESLNTAAKFRRMYEVFRKVNPVGNTLDYLASFNAIRRANEIGYGASKLATLRTIGKGVGALYRDVRVFNAAVSEAKAEAAFSYQDLKDVLTDKYKSEHDGSEPIGKDAQEIQDAAMGAAQTNGVANTYLIMLSNQLFMGNVMKGFGGLSRMEASAERGILRLGDKAAAKTGTKFVNAAENKWMAFKQGLLRTPLEYVGANLGEGLQESFQDVSHDAIQNEAIQNFYQAKYNNNEAPPTKSIVDFIKDAAADQFNTKGAKTFISGFLTGAILAPGRYAFGKAGNIQQYITDKSGYQQRQTEIRQNQNAIIEAANKIWNNPLSFDYKQGDLTLQANFGAILNDAAQSKDKHAFYDIKDDALRHFILTGIRSGSVDSFTDRLKSYAKNLSPEEFSSAFGVEFNDKNYAAITDQIDQFSNRASEIKDLHERASSELVNPFDPFRFKAEQRVPENQEFLKEAIAYRAWNDAVDNYVFTKSYYQDTIKGQANILSALKNDANLNSVNFNDIYLLTSTDHVNAEIDLLQSELKNIQVGGSNNLITPFSSQKQERLSHLLKYKENLDRWAESHDNLSRLPPGNDRTKAFEESFTSFRENASPVFEGFINNELKAADKPLISKDNLSRAFDSLHNYMKLQKESGIILDKVNLLADPVHFFDFYTTHHKLMKLAYESSILSGKSKDISDAQREERQQQRKKQPKQYDKNPPWVKKGTNGTLLYRLPGDNRIGKDLIAYYGIEDGAEGSLKSFLVSAINNPWTHPYLKEAFSKFLPYVKDNATVRFDTKQTIAPGFYTFGTDRITVDPELHETDMSFEGVMLHELIHALTSDELSSEGYFSNEIQKLYKAAENYLDGQGIDTSYYGFSNTHEFLAEIYSNPEFQRELSAIPSDNNTSLWEKFLDILSRFLKEKFGLEIKPSILDDVFFKVEEYLDSRVYDKAVSGLKQKGMTQEELQRYSKREIIDIAAQEGIVDLANSRDAVTVNWEDNNGNKQFQTFSKGQIYVGRLSQLEKYRGRNKTALQFNNDKITIVAVSKDGKTVSVAVNGEPAVDFDALEFAKLAKAEKWVDFKTLQPVHKAYLALRNKVITYRLLQRDSKGFPLKGSKGEFIMQEVKGRVKLNNSKDMLLFAYGDKTVEFNQAYVVNKEDLSGLPTIEAQALKEEQERIQRNFQLQVGILEEAYKEVEAKIELQKSLSEANKTEFEKTQKDIADLNAHLDLVIEALEKKPYKGKGRISNETKELKNLKDKLSTEIGEKNTYLQRLILEKEAFEKSYESLKQASDLYAQAYIELQENVTPFDRSGNETIYEEPQRQLNELQHNQVNNRLSDEKIQELITDAGTEMDLLHDRIAIVQELIVTAERALRRIAKFDDILSAISAITDKRQLISYLSNLKKQEEDIEKRGIITSLIKGLNKGDTALETQYILEKAAVLKASRIELRSLLDKAAAIQDKFDRLTLSREERKQLDVLQERVDYLKDIQHVISERYAKIKAQQDLIRQIHVAKAKAGELTKELHDFGNSMSSQPVIVSEESAFISDNSKPRLDQIGLFKTADRHFWKDTDTAPTSDQAARFFKFSEHLVPNADYFFQVVTAKNDIYGIRTPDAYPDDIKVIVVKKEGDAYTPVGVDGTVLSRPDKDNIVYTSLHGNDKLLDQNLPEAIKWVEENFTVKGMKREEIGQKIIEYKAFRSAIKDKILNNEDVYLTIVAKSNGIVVREPLDIHTGKPQQLSLSGRLIVADNSDWTNIRHPDGASVNLEVSTTGSIINKKIKAGRVALVKEDGSIFQIYNRELNSDEKENVIAVLKRVAPMMGRRYLDQDRLSEIEMLVKNGKISTEQASHLTNPLSENEQDYFDKAIHYLMGILYWRQQKEGEAVGNDQFRISKGMLYRGNLAIPFNGDSIELNKNALLQGVYHQVNNKKLANPNEAFYELIANGNEVKEKRWDNYGQYLLDDSGDRNAPLYTNVKPYTSGTDIHNNQLRSVYLIYGYHSEFSSSDLPTKQATNTNGEIKIYADPLAVPRDKDLKIAFIRKRADKTTDLYIVTQWEDSRFKVVKMVDANGVDHTANQKIKEQNESYINSAISELGSYGNMPDIYDSSQKAFRQVYHRIETYIGQAENVSGKEGSSNDVNLKESNTAGKNVISDVINEVLGIANTDQNYFNWSNTRDGKDRDVFVDQITSAVQQLASVERAKLTEAAINDYLKVIKAFHNNEIRKVVTAILMKPLAQSDTTTTATGQITSTAEQTEAVSEDTKHKQADTYTPAEIDALVQQAIKEGNNDIIDENARLSLEDDPLIKEDIASFKEWLKERLPQIPVHKVLHLINGRNWGQFINGAIQIYQHAEQGTGYHEAFEAVWNTYLTVEEQNALAEEFRGRQGEFTNVFSRSTKKYTEASLYDVREMLAEEFRDYILNDGKLIKESSPVRNSIFRKLWNFIKKMLGLSLADNASFNSHIQTLFSKINAGRYASTPPVSIATNPSFRALEGTSVDFTQQLMEGMASIFFSKLYVSQKNIESLFSRGNNSRLFNSLYNKTREAVEQYFNAPITSIAKVLSDKGIAHEKITAEVTRYTNTLEYKQKKAVLDRFNGDVFAEFKRFLGQFGLQFNELNDPGNVFSDTGEDNINEIEEKEFALTNALGIRESIYIDPRNMTKSTIRLLIASLTADEYRPNSTQVQIKKNVLGLPTLADYGRKLNILLNELHSIVPVYEGGKRIDAIDLMFRKLDDRFKGKDGKFKQGFEWIQKLKSRLKYELNGQKIDFLHLNDDEIRLLIGFEASFSNNKNHPFKLLVGEGGYITAVDPVVVTNSAKVKERWQNDLKSSLRVLREGEELAAAPLVYIDTDGKVMFNKWSGALARLLEASTNQGKLDSLRKIGIVFTQPDIELLTDSDKIRTIATSFNNIRYAFKEGLIHGFDDFFGKQVINGPVSSLLAIELSAIAEDNILSHQNAAGKQQYSITLPSAVSAIVNSLKGISNIRDFILTNPQYGSVSASGEILLNPYQANSQLLQPGGMIFDKKGNKKREIDYQFILGMSLLTDSEGDNTDELKYPDKIVQEIYHLLNGTYYTVINSDKSSEFGLNMGHFISWQDIKKPIESNSYIIEAYKKALLDEVKAAVFEVRNPTNIQYYSEGVTSLGHFRDILGFILKEDKKQSFSSLQKEFVRDVLKGKESAEDFVNRNQVEALIVKYLNDQVRAHQKFLIDLGLVKEIPVSSDIVIYSTNAFSGEQLQQLGITDAEKISAPEFSNIVKFLTINRQINVFEQHKLLYGHPALYKDLAKRSNGINSQKEMITENSQVLNWMDKHMKRLDGRMRGGQQESTFRFVSYKDPIVLSRYHQEIASGIYSSLIKDLPHHVVEKLIGATFHKDGSVKTIEGGKGTYMDAYLNANEPDGQAYVMMDFFRDMMYLSGKFTKNQAALWEYEKASEIVDRSDPTSDYYKHFTKEEIENARNVLSEGKPDGILQALKPQGFGYQTTEGVTHTTFLKHSVFPLTWNRVKEHPAMAKLYINSQQHLIDIIGFESGEKVGNVLQTGSFVDLYNAKGEFNEAQLPVQEMYTRFYGIQVEMAAKTKEKVIMGTQMRKLILSNLPEELKGVAEVYFRTLEELMRLEKQSLLKELGLIKNEEGDYQTDNLEGLVNTLRKEAISRDLPDNVIDMISAVKTEAGDELVYKFDANPIREKIDNILNSIVDSRVISQKMFGKASVQVASTLWEKEARSFMYLKQGIWTSTDGIDINSLSKEEKTTLRMVSSDLKFYTKEEPWMEIMLPHYFEGILPKDVDLERLDPRILQAIGFRIPTQGMNSIDNIRIKGFLDPSMGDIVVVPSEIVGKSGSDFDIDKLNIFLANYYIERLDFGSKQFKDFLLQDLIANAGYSENYISQLVSQLEIEDIKKINSSTYTEYGKLQKGAISSLEGISNSEVEYEILSKVKEAITRYNHQYPEKKPVIKYVDPNGTSKEALQNRLISLMGQILSHPDNYRQLVVPNGAETLKGLADEIRELKNNSKEGKSLTKLSEWQTMAETRERYISGKKLVGIGALQITSHAVSQLAGITLTGSYKTRDGQQLPVVIKFDHHSEEGKFYLNAVRDKGYQYISELLSEALTGFVDAAKDPFVFDLNLNLQTAATWFYLQKLGVPARELAYFHAQPLIEKYFAELGKNQSYVNKANDTEMVREMVIFKAADEYFKKAFEHTRSLYQLGLSDANGKWKTRRDYFKLKEDLLSRIAKYRSGIEKYSATDLKNNIHSQNQVGYHLNQEDALNQLALLFDYLDYQQQAGYLSNFINAISYDTAKTKNIIENQIQDSMLETAYTDNFITKESIDRVFETTFLGEVKLQKQDTANMFKEFFVTLHPNAQVAFEKVLALINHPELSMTKDQKADILNRYQNFFITSLLHTVKFKAGEDERSLNEWYGLFFGDHSFARQLRDLQHNAKYKDNAALKQLFPLVNTDRKSTDNVKLFNNKLSTYEINVISESLLNLKQQAEAENDMELRQFIARLGVFAILQSGVQVSPITYTKVLPIEIYSNIAGNILDRFTQADIDTIDPALIWKQFHQNNWYNGQIVPKIKRFYREDNGLISVSGNYKASNYDYVSTRELKSAFRGKVNPQRDELVKNKRWSDLYDFGLFERIHIYNENGEDVTDHQPTKYYRPVNRLGNRMNMTEVYATGRESVLPDNEPFDESLYEEAVSQVMNNTDKPMNDLDVDNILNELDCSGPK